MGNLIHRIQFFNDITYSKTTALRLLWNNFLYSITVRNEVFKQNILSNDQVRSYRLKLYDTDCQLHMRIQDIAIFLEIFQYEMYHIDSLQDGVILDLGGHIGFQSIYMILKNHIEENIYIVEPSKNNFNILLKNIQPFHNIIGINKAISTHSNGVSFKTEGYGHNFKIQARRNEISTIPSVTINNIIDKYNIHKIALLKMDIEGHEKEVFSSKELDWLSITDKIKLEIHDDYTIESLLSVVSDYNFKLTASEKSLILLEKNA